MNEIMYYYIISTYFVGITMFTKSLLVALQNHCQYIKLQNKVVNKDFVNKNYKRQNLTIRNCFIPRLQHAFARCESNYQIKYLIQVAGNTVIFLRCCQFSEN